MKNIKLDRKKEYGLVFSGGGTKGCYEIGVWKALDELGVKILAVAGTSIGAINGALFCNGNYDLAYDRWVNASIDEYLDVKDDNLISLFIESVSGGINTEPLKRVLEKSIDENTVRNSPVDFGLATFSLTDMKPVMLMKKDIPEGKMIDYIIASASIPALLKSQEIDGKKFIDGGVYSNNPVPLLAEHGIKNIIEVDISGIGVSRKYNKEKLGLQCLYTIRNSVDIIGTLEFNKVKILEGIDIGYYDTMKAFGEISGAKYYIENKESEYLYPLSDDELIFVLDKLHSDLEFSFKNQRQNLIKTLEEYSTGKINTCSILGICLEISAELFDISKKKLYTFDSLLNELMQKYESIKELYTKKDINEIMETLKKRKWKEISGINLVVALLFLQEDDMLDPTFLLNFFRKAYISYIFLTIVKKRLSSL